MGVMRISANSLTSDVGIGSRPQDLDGEEFRILSRLSSDTGVKEDSVFLVELGLVTEDGVDDWSVDLILRILSEKKLTKGVRKVGFICTINCQPIYIFKYSYLFHLYFACKCTPSQGICMQN